MTTASYRRDHDHHAHHDTRPLIDRVAADWGNALWLVGRVLIGVIFVQSGFGKLTNLVGFADMLDRAGVPFAYVIAPFGAVAEFAGGIAIMLGIATRYAALVMIGFVIVATLISHRFWAVPADQQPMQMVQFAKNVAIVGGFLMVFVTGGGRYALDRRLHHHDDHPANDAR
jgi:putative oxidoreductase